MDDGAKTILGAEAQENKPFIERSAFDDKYRIFHTLNQARSTIVSLRAQVERLTPKAEAYDVIARMWQNQRDSGDYAAIDTAYEIGEMTARMEREFEREKQAAYEAQHTQNTRGDDLYHGTYRGAPADRPDAATIRWDIRRQTLGSVIGPEGTEFPDESLRPNPEKSGGERPANAGE